MKDLLPCPLCGNAELNTQRDTIGHGQTEFVIVCPCGCRFGGGYDSEAKTVTRWNTRPVSVLAQFPYREIVATDAQRVEKLSRYHLQFWRVIDERRSEFLTDWLPGCRVSLRTVIDRELTDDPKNARPREI